MTWIARPLRRLPLTLKLILLTLAGGLLVWKGLDELQTREIRELLHDEVSQRLNEQAREDRLLFDEHRRGYYQALKLFASQRRLVEHVRRQTDSWSTGPAKLVYHRELPDWLPGQSVIRALAPARFWLLLDARGRPREIYQHGQDPLPESLAEFGARLGILSHVRLMMTEIDGTAYLLAADSVRSASGAELGFLMLGTPIDDDFLAAAQSTRGAEHLMVLLSEDGNTVLASSRPEQVPAGSFVPLLHARFFVMGKSFFDYGTSELRTGLASLMPKSQLEALSSRLLAADKRNRAITAATIILAFAVLMSWVSRRVNRVTSEISEFSRSNLGTDPHASLPGDSLHRLREEFRFLASAVIDARAALEHEAEEKLRLMREAAEVFRDLIEKAPDALVIVRGEHLLFVNPALVSSLAYQSAAELCGRKLIDLVEASGREKMAQLVRAAEQGEPARPLEARFLRRDGELATLEVSPGPLVRFEGAPATLLMARDVTERKKMEGRLLLADRMASVGVLASGVAHEINNPLTYVITNLELARAQLGQHGEGFEPILGRVSKALEGAERVRVIVRHLKTFSRADEERLGPVDIREVLETSIAMAGNEIRHRARLTRELEPVPAVRANEGRLAQVFLNLLVNAAQAMPEEQLEAGEIRVRSRTEPGGWVVVEVEDTGTGIAPEHLGRIFDPFFTTKPVGKGTGLGLSISHGIVSGLGGTIDARSELGKGTCLRIALPACAEAAPRVERRAPPTAVCGRARILVVDDEPDVGEALELALEPEHEVLSVQEGRGALARLAAGDRFDLIFCDLMMPGMSGMDLFGEISRLVPEQAERMVFITAGAFTPWSREFLCKVPNPCLEKPFRLESLQATVGERLSHFGLTRVSAG
jgi:PAS domain S-box-containing protein